MKCSKCGLDLQSNESFCMNCGEKNPEAIAKEPQDLIAPKTPQIVSSSYTETAQKSEKTPKKRDAGAIVLWLIQSLICLLISSLMFLFPFFEKSVAVSVAGEDFRFFGDSSFFNLYSNLVLGTERSNPSVLSIVMGVTVIIFIFAASAFWLFSAIATLIRKGEAGVRRMSVVLTFIALGTACSLPHLAYMFVSQFKHIYSRLAGVLPEDMKSVTSPVSYVWAGIIVLLTAAVLILASKRRRRKEVVEDEKK